jgi:hypothetical protein
MSDRLEEIENRSSDLVAYYSDTPDGDMRAGDDFEWLIAEVKRLRESLAAHEAGLQMLETLTTKRRSP